MGVSRLQVELHFSSMLAPGRLRVPSEKDNASNYFQERDAVVVMEQDERTGRTEPRNPRLSLSRLV